MMKLLLYILKACTVHIFLLSWICIADVSKNEYGSIHVYSCCNIYQHQYEDMRGQNVSCRLSCFVLFPQQADWFNCPGPPSGENDDQSLDLCGLRCVENLWNSPILTIFIYIYIHIYIYNLLKLWGQILKCEVISSMFYVQPLTYGINLYNLYCLRRIKKTPN